MDFATQPASNYAVAELAGILNQGFEDYFIPIHFSTSMFLNMLHRDSIDVSSSLVLSARGRPCGIALVARRSARQASRLAAMGIAKHMRSMGAGSWLMKKLIDDACKREDHEMVLEVIEQNEPAVRLYQRYGFEPIRRLVGFLYRDSGTKPKPPRGLHESHLHHVSQLISQQGLPDLPWQLSGESLIQMSPPLHAYRDGKAYMVVSDLEAEHVVIWSLLVETDGRGNGLGARMLKRIIEKHPRKIWHVPALCPEEFGSVFERAGFEKEKLSQWQMRLGLEDPCAK